MECGLVRACVRRLAHQQLSRPDGLTVCSFPDDSSSDNMRFSQMAMQARMGAGVVRGDDSVDRPRLA